MESFVYFCSDEHRHAMRIGYSDKIEKRLEAHKKYGLELAALVRGSRDIEENLHIYFGPHRLGRDKSTYLFARVNAYAERLLEWKFATKELGKKNGLPMLPWQTLNPLKVMRPLEDRDGQLAFLVTESIATDERDTWQTPQDIVDICKEGLGGRIDLDPCSCFEANERVGARYFFTEADNGLRHQWNGSVFVNPPYGGGREPMAKLFAEKLVNELEEGRVTRAITVLNLQSIPTLWFPIVRKAACSHAILARRINFIGPPAKSGSGATRFSSSKNGTIFSFFGEGKEDFERAFKGVGAMVVREV